ncbi:hypothetical protein LTR36_001989 [Oleoguttula mirabilis]|uniref:Uncharacterized protein n=1 Tax=Oleoguttula mirabilis TaxID=1507867 RepID=A0AAV9JLY9_9PEZI|nr:hypothetical protein LTR36_001989 [Oleoguttula mirabilis]
MDVQLYVYDLTHGMAKNMSRQFLGIQIDAVYHTALVFNGIEYFFGSGVQTCYAGRTHHGRPMEVIPMGTTHLPMEDILEYLESLKQIYTPESYDLFAHNCNNFTNDFAMFLVGKGIPDHITSLPKRVLDTPFGQMLKPQIDAGMRSVTQASVPARNVPSAANGGGGSSISQPKSVANGKPATQAAPILLGNSKPVTYGKVPPLEKLVAKLGEMRDDAALLSLKTFIQQRNVDPREAPLPDLEAVGQAFQSKVLTLPVEVRFAAVDLLRCAMIDPRVSGFFAEEKAGSQTADTLIDHVNELADCPHNLRLVTIHLACNLFTSPLYTKQILHPEKAIATKLVQLVTSSLLDASHPTTRVAASWLAFNLAAANHRSCRGEGREALAEGQQVELAASLIEVLGSEDNGEAVKAQLLGLGYLVYGAPRDGEVLDLAKALDAKATVSAIGKGNEALAKEVAGFLS